MRPVRPTYLARVPSRLRARALLLALAACAALVGSTTTAVAAPPTGLYTANTDAQTGSTNATGIDVDYPHFSWTNQAGAAVDRQRTQIWDDDPTSVVSLWHFDGNGTDVVGGSTMVAQNGAGFAAGAAGFGQAADMTANSGGPQDDYFRSGYLPAYNTPTFTVELWFKTSSLGASYDNIISRGPTSGTEEQFQLIAELGTRNLMLCTTRVTNVENCTGQSGPPYYDDNQWHYAALTSDGTTQRLYVDGNLRITHAIGGTLEYASTEPIAIGHFNGFSGCYCPYQGVVDEVRFTNRARTAEEIAAIYHAMAPFADTATLLWDSDPSDTGHPIASCSDASRCEDIAFGGSPSIWSIASTYFVRTKFKLAGGAWDSWSTADWFRRKGPPSYRYITGYETGVLSTAGGGLQSTLFGGAANQASNVVRRSGDYALEVVHAGSSGVETTVPAMGRFVGRFAVRIDQFPSSDQAVLRAYGASATWYDQLLVSSTGQLKAQAHGGVAATGPTLALGTWYVVDVQLDTTTSTHTISWRVDGAVQATASAAGLPVENVTKFRFGGDAAAGGWILRIDDVAVTDDPADYPLGDGYVLGLRPDGVGTHNNPGNFQDDDSTALDATSWSRLVDNPFGPLTSYIKQVANSSTSYAELTFADNPEVDPPLGITAVVAQHAAGTLANNGQARIVRGDGGFTTVYSGAMNLTTLQYKRAVVQPQAFWTNTAIDALTARVGYSSDSSPNPYWDAVLLEADYPVTTIPAPTTQFVDDTDAQSGTANPTTIIDPTPRLSWVNAASTATVSQRTSVVTSTLDDVLGLWHLDGDRVDATGNGYDASGTGGTPGYTAGATDFGQALTLAGSGDQATVAHDTAFDLQTFTVDAWFRMNAPPGAAEYPTIFAKETATLGNYRMYVDGPTNQFTMHFTVGGVHRYGCSSGSLPNAAAYQDGAWHHAALTSDGATVRMYLDGVYQCSRSTGGTIDTPATPLRIGGASGPAESWIGELDEVRVSTVERSAAELLGYARTRRPHDTVMWDSSPGDAGVAMTSCAAAARCEDVTYGTGGGALPLIRNGARYYARQKQRIGAGDWTEWSSWDWFEVQGAISVGLVGGDLDMGTSTPANDVTGTRTFTVDSNNADGYSLVLHGPSDSYGLTDGSPPDIPAWTGTPAAPTQWLTGTPGGFGVSVVSATGGKDTARWGTSTTMTDLDNLKFAGPQLSTSTLLHQRTGYAAGTDSIVLGLRVNAAVATPPGAYATTLSVTAVANP